MVAKMFIWYFFTVSLLILETSASYDEESSTKGVDELLEKVANSLAGNDKCKSMELPGDCTITDDCLTITCSAMFGSKYTTLTMSINRCDEPVTVTINIKVADNDIDWTQVFTSGSELPVPGLAVDVPNFGKGGLFIKTEILPEDDGMLTFKITLEAGTETESLFRLKLPIVAQKLPISTDHCDFIRWWEARNTAERVALLLVTVLLILSIITGCCCGCCCCCRPCKKRSAYAV